MPGNKRRWKWTILIEMLVALALWSNEHGVLKVAETPSAISEQYLGLLAVAGVAMLLLASVRQSPSRIGWPDLWILTLALPLIAWWILDRGMLHIGGYDHSVLANYGWVLLQGLRPHVDFPCTLCPHFYLGIKYGYAWFGVAWRSTVILAAIYSTVSFAWAYLLLRAMDLPPLSAVIVSLLTQSLCLMLGGYFWYNTVGCTDATILVLAALAWVDRPRSKLLAASVTIALALVMLDKPNGWVLPACLAVGFLGSREHRFRFAGCVLSALGLILTAAYFGPFDISATLTVYSRLAKSRSPGMDAVLHSLQFDTWHAPVESGKLCVLVVTFLTAAAFGLWTHREARRKGTGRWWARLWTYAGALAIGTAFFFTNYEYKGTDLAVPTTVFALWVAKSEPWTISTTVERGRRVAVACGMWLCLFCLFQGLLYGWVRHRVYCICPNEFWQRTISDDPPATAFMAGVRGSPRLVKVMRDLDHAVAKHPNQTIFFGPWLEFAYPAFGRRPLVGFPIWWHPGISYLPQDDICALLSSMADRSEILIFLKRDRTLTANFYHMPDLVPELIGKLYTLDENCETVAVYRRRPKT